MTHSTPGVLKGILSTQNGTLAIPVGSAEWFSWLAEHRTFRFHSDAGMFTARQEPRATGLYWYAYRRQKGHLNSAYLGKSEHLTLEQLTLVARNLTSSSAPDAYKPGPLDQRFLLTTKVIPPALYTAFLPRPRLLALLRKQTAYTLLLVTGPAGSGKTTLLIEWLQQLTYPVAWVSLDADDNDLARFWSYVLAALQRYIPGIAAHMFTLLPTLQATTLEPFLIPLLNALASLPGEVALVLDDYHFVTNPRVHESIVFLLEHAPEQLHLMITSRTLPPLPLPRLRAHGNLVEVHFSDLRFTDLEAQDLLTSLMGYSPSPEHFSELMAYTEGWATGLYLVALASNEEQHSINNQVSVSRHLNKSKSEQGWSSSPSENRDLSSPKSASENTLEYQNHSMLFEYLASEVLARLPEPLQDFLMHCSILERFNVDLCTAVTLQEQSSQMLARLEYENLFLLPLDNQHHWYRYHQLFAAFLRARLAQMYPDLAPTLHTRATHWYAQHDMPAEAIAHGLQADTPILAAQLIEEQGRNILMSREILVLRDWLNALPATLLFEHPRLCVYAAWTQLHTSHNEPVENYLSAAEQRLERLEATKQQALRGEILAIRARTAIYQDKIETSVTLAHQALDCLAIDDHYLRGEVTLSLGTASEALGQTQQATRAYHEAIILSQRSNNLRAALLGTRSLAMLYVDQGKLHQAMKLYQDNLEHARHTNLEHLPPIGFLYGGLGELFYEQNKLEEAESHLRAGIALGQRGGDVKIWLTGYVWLTYVTSARGEQKRAWELFARAEQMARQAGFLRGLDWLAEVRQRLSLIQGDPSPLLEWAQTCKLDPGIPPGMLNSFAYYQLARALLAQNDPDQALSILHQLLTHAEQTQKAGQKISLLLSIARAYHLRLETRSALEALAQSLVLAQKQGYIRTFLDEGPQIATLLSELHQNQRFVRCCSPDYLNRLLQAFRHDLANPDNQEILNPSIEALSKREWEVLRLLATGVSNQEIAEILTIGLNTVKTHTKNIYGKLGVNNRTQATIRAHTLQLL